MKMIPTYYDAIQYNNIGINSMLRNGYDDANRYIQTSLQCVQALVESNHQQQLHQANNETNSSNISSFPQSTTTTATMLTTLHPASSLSSSCTNLHINHTIECDEISLNTMMIDSATNSASSNAHYINTTLQNNNTNGLSQFRPIQMQMPMTGTSIDTSTSILLQQPSMIHHRMNRLDMTSCAILHNIAICFIYHDIYRKSSSEASKKEHRHTAFQVLIIAHSIISDILSGAWSIDEDLIPLWFGVHQMEYRILSVMIYLIQLDDENRHVPTLPISSSSGYDQLLHRFNYVQKIVTQDQNIINILFETNHNTNIAPCA